MINITHRLAAGAALLAVALFNAGVATASTDIKISEAWIREAPPGARSLAGYARISNNSNMDTYLEGASSSAFGMTMLHMSKMDSHHKMSMQHMDRITVPAGKSIELKPGGMHIMLMHPNKEFRAGDRISITLEFSDGVKKTVDFPVVKK